MALVGYARTSVSEQNPQLQVEALEAAGVGRIFLDAGVSGTLASRPQFDAALAYLREGDTFVVWKLDRLGRSTRNVLVVLDRLKATGVRLHSLTEGLDASGPMGEAIVTIMAAFAQLERDQLVERTKAGLAIAPSQGRLGGRPRVLTAQKVAMARTLYDSGGYTAVQIAGTLAVSPATVYRYLASSGGTEKPLS